MSELARLVSGNPRLVPLFAVMMLIAVMAVAVAMIFGRMLGRAESRREYERMLPEAREDAVKRSRAALSGQISEQLAPYLPGFPANPDDARFLGKPVDFVVFDGLSRGAVRGIVFVEVKSGSSALNANERGIRDAIESGRVSWAEYRVP